LAKDRSKRHSTAIPLKFGDETNPRGRLAAERGRGHAQTVANGAGRI